MTFVPVPGVLIGVGEFDFGGVTERGFDSVVVFGDISFVSEQSFDSLRVGKFSALCHMERDHK